jgi:hypothetical protein
VKAGEAFTFIVKRKTAAGEPALGLSLGAFIARFLKNSTVTTIADLACAYVDTVGAYARYAFTGTTPTGGPYAFSGDIVAASSTDVIADGVIRGEIESYDIDAIAALAATPVASSASPVSIGGTKNIEMVAYRQNPFAESVVDQNGDAIDLSGYTTWRFGVWDRAHTGTIFYSLTGSGWGDASGNVTFTIPEDAAFYSQIAAALALSQDSKLLYYDVIADAAGSATATRPILRGTLNLLRYEGAP